MKSGGGGVAMEVIIFAVGQQEYAVPITAVMEVQAWTQPTPVPDAPPIVEGVIDLRGEVIPVVDLGRRFGIARRKADADSCIMVMDIEGRHAGWIVDEVKEVYTAEEGDFSPTSPLLLRMRGTADDPMVAGVLRAGEGRLVVVLEAAAILRSVLEVG